MKSLVSVGAVVFLSCGGGSPSVGGMGTAGGAADGGGAAAGGAAGGSSAGDGGGPAPDGGWGIISVRGTTCALGAAAGLGYSPGASDELLLFVQGGGACWNNGTCQPSVFEWGPVCNYGRDSVCLFDAAGGTRPIAAHVNEADPFPVDGGGAWTSELGTVKSSIFFQRRPENPMARATFAFIPYCTGDLHAGAATRTYFVKGGPFDQAQPVTHRFAGAANLDAYLAALRARHPNVSVVWLVGVSGGGYGAQLNLHRVRAVFPEAKVHVLADSAPMMDSVYFAQWAREWNLQYPPGCSSCADGGLPAIFQRQASLATESRLALLAFAEDQTITRFFFSPGTTGGWLTPPAPAYVAALGRLEALIDATPSSRVFRLPGTEHVMLPGAGQVLADGGLTASLRSSDGGVSLKGWIDAWALGDAGWENAR